MASVNYTSLYLFHWRVVYFDQLSGAHTLCISTSYWVHAIPEFPFTVPVQIYVAQSLHETKYVWFYCMAWTTMQKWIRLFKNLNFGWNFQLVRSNHIFFQSIFLNCSHFIMLFYEKANKEFLIFTATYG